MAGGGAPDKVTIVLTWNHTQSGTGLSSVGTGLMCNKRGQSPPDTPGGPQ